MRWLYVVLMLVWIGLALFGWFTDSSTAWIMGCLVISQTYQIMWLLERRSNRGR